MRTFISATLKRAPQRKVEKFNKCRDGPGSIQGGGGAPSFMGQRFRGGKKKVDVIVVSVLTREHLLWS